MLNARAYGRGAGRKGNGGCKKIGCFVKRKLKNGLTIGATEARGESVGKLRVVKKKKNDLL
jgi:hypothetical protein